MLDAIRWFRTRPVPAGRMGAVDVFECALFAILKGFGTGLAVNLVAALAGMSIQEQIRPIQYETYGYEGLFVVVDFIVLLSGPVIGLVAGMVSTRLLRRGWAGLANTLVTWICGTALGTGLVGLAFAYRQGEVPGESSGVLVGLIWMNLVLVHGTLIGIYFWRRTLRFAEAELLTGPAPPRFQLRTLSAAALIVAVVAIPCWTVFFLELL